ncbi:pyridoxal kinase [Cutibacterium acnes]|uniref:pyridoxal kinase n=1 Tax=Cutibacterium acnes TaxID=1747 RepID=UPI000203FB4A|nr:pyridoxal kinase [Cutibacterium acnes]EGE72211.1 pyridoxal kinase [Cutibacterium acnes HL097PA1]EIA11216.1 pyridoxamine kinase [Cutibacterium acnes PRP-38]REB14399.1 pyridoxal kinase [Cutibacterium acnes]REB18327.1 pyridoxal kinase [Cutibacterium acnes]TLG24511.1 pyridoxal kinase [Cutibacterium acnes]
MSVTVLSLQSHVVQGTVGNSIAVPVMRAMGVRAWGMPTALLSNHNGRSSVAGIPIDSEQIDAMVNALDSNGELKHVDAVLSGYLTPRTGPAVLRTVERCRTLHPDTIWVCDPVMGDMTPDGELRAYVPDETVSLMTDAVQHADVVVPNLAELGILTGTEPRTLDDIVRAARSLTGPHLVIVTSVPYDDGIAMVGVTGDKAVLTHGPLLDRHFNGAGDLTSAVLTAGLVKGEPLDATLGKAAGVVHTVLERTVTHPGDELDWWPEDAAAQPWKTVILAPNAPSRVGRSS